ncbi:MAG: hypothetical protein U1G07_12430 [Verrucomicrobiota bacterium]
MVDEEAAAQAQKQLEALVAKGRKPYFDLNHDDQEAAAWPTEFFWKGEGANPACMREWSGPSPDWMQSPAAPTDPSALAF